MLVPHIVGDPFPPGALIVIWSSTQSPTALPKATFYEGKSLQVAFYCLPLTTDAAVVLTVVVTCEARVRD